MSVQRPGPLRRAGLMVFKWIPPRPSHAIIRLVTPTYSVGAIAIIEHDGRVLALRQTHRRGMSLPGGLVDRGEQPHEAVVREVREETGLRIESGDVFATVFDADMQHLDVIFRVPCDREPRVTPASEATGYAWLDPSQWDSFDSDWGDLDTPTARILQTVRAAREKRRPGRVLG